jgi:hypothetical protein
VGASHEFDGHFDLISPPAPLDPTSAEDVCFQGQGGSRDCVARLPSLTQLGRSLAEMGEHRTKVSMISTLDDIWRKGSKRASSTSILASLYRLSMIPFQLVHQSI